MEQNKTTMNNLDKDYLALCQDILDNGTKKQTRTGTDSISVFGRQIRHKMSDGFPLLTTKKMAWKQIVTELLWFLRGDTNIKYLIDNDCHIWDGDAYKNFEKWYNEHSGKEDYTGYYVPTKEEFIRLIKTDDEFAKKWGELGPIYGKQWRKWAKFNEKVYTKQIREVPEGGRFAETRNVNWVGGSEVAYIDQIANLISELKTNPDSRRLMVNAWNVGEIENMVLPPCHFNWQCYSHEKDGKRYLSLAWNQRSCDIGLGIPFNIASYGLLLEIIAKEVNMIPYELIGNLGDCHIYNNHVNGLKEQLTRDPFKLSKLKIKDKYITDISQYEINDFELIDYEYHSSIKLPLSN